jgi:hypothetical protein
MMSWDAVFALTNAVALAAWLALLLLPRTAKVLAGILYLGVALLCLGYVTMIVGMHAGWIDAARPAGAPPPNILDYTISGLQNLFVSQGGLVMGWTHYLALDLFTGWWIAQDADARRLSRIAQAPVLLLTFAAGPVGLLTWLAVRSRLAGESLR